jgi:hypothetical protein
MVILWYGAIQNEMANVRVAFNILEPGADPPVGYKCIPFHMVFDIKMEFMIKPFWMQEDMLLLYYLLICHVTRDHENCICYRCTR